MNKKLSFIVLVFTVLLLVTLFIIPPDGIIAASQGDNETYITSRMELANALANKKDVIYVGDIEFDEKDIYLEIKQSVKFIGKPDGSILKKGIFHVEGSEVESELITVSFENIIFDGCYTCPEGRPEEAASFDAFHGDRTDKGCLFVKGFVQLAVQNCTVKNYCTKYGAGIYLQYTDGNEDIGTRANVSLKACTFTGNICEKGVFWCNGKNTLLEMTDCSFSGNYAYTGIVMLGGINGKLDNVVVKNNIRVSFKEKNSFKTGGGGISLAKSDAVIKNCLIEGNSAPCGGGILVTASKLTMDNCKVLNNTADDFGGGMALYSDESFPIYITNCLISGNKAKEEGAVWVGPADQIGIGVPTGIVELSFCTLENNTSEDEEHLIFHPIMLENADSKEGRNGKIDFIACRIIDSKVTRNLKDDENYNVINSERKGSIIPKEVLDGVANGYYFGKNPGLYPGINEIPDLEKEKKGSDTDRQNAVIILCAVCAVVLAGIVFFVVRSVKNRRERENIGIYGQLSFNKSEQIIEPKDIGTEEENDQMTLEQADADKDEAKELTERKIEELARERSLTERETEVLREYVSGKTRTQISEALFISESTVKNHISNIFSKLGVKNKEGLLKMVDACQG
ncbi:MAG: right-handed parallel beta-helix repeat-containing protein [Lachnospiraceae bacterium]|nr:right-handed parallel beta-helix repeat-containing protein [Lachnospiraceae bacterium]